MVSSQLIVKIIKQEINYEITRTRLILRICIGENDYYKKNLYMNTLLQKQVN